MPRLAKSPIEKVPTNTPRGRVSMRTTPAPKKRGANANGDIPTARRGIDTSTNATAALVDVNKPLTEMQKNFVRMWAQGESITAASHRAGYADNATFAYRMVHMPNIRALYEAEKRLYEEASQMTRKRVMDGLLEGVELAKMAGEPASVISGWREIGKMCGYYEPKKVTVDVTVTGSAAMQKMARMSDAELLKLITAEVQDVE
jgi:hypothetical protein